MAAFPAVAQSVTHAASDCLFNWAEKNYSGLFSPAGATSQTYSSYYYRYYPKTNAYLGVSSADDHLYYLSAADGKLLDVGSLAGWVFTSNCSSVAWEKVVGDGFGSTANSQITEFHEFNGALYAGTGRSASGAAEVWRSTSGNAGSWSRITSFSPSLASSGTITSFASSSLGGGIMWLGSSSAAGAAIYRSTDGTNWTRINKPGFGVTTNITAAPNMVVFKGTGDSTYYLYSGAGSHGGTTTGKVYRTPYDNTSSDGWTTLVDFDTTDPSVTTITYFYLWNNKIYFATTGGQLWESSDGINFTKNAGVGNGFGSTTAAIASLVDFKGYLYASTTNKTTGGQLWRSADGITWSAVTTNAFGKGNKVEELHNLRTSSNRIWVTAYTNETQALPTPVWYSDDGVNFTQANQDGFGETGNYGGNPVTMGFGNYQYHGGPNSLTGGQIWRLRTQ